MAGEHHHFVLVHGLCHGAWCWFKLLTLLKSSGHKATAIDLGGCGIDPRRVGDILTLEDYFGPLMDLVSSLPEHEKVVLVAHSFGGLGVSLAMEKFPHKVLVAVFVCAYMPNFISPFSVLVEETFRRTPIDQFMDAEFGFDRGTDNLPTSMTIGPEMMSTKLYQNCTPEDLELGERLVRASGLFNKELAQEGLVTREKFGSVDRAFVVCEEDRLMKEDFQRWIIENSPPKEVKSIQGADHMAMLSTPTQLFLCLIEIANGYPY